MNKWNVANYITFHSSRDSMAVNRSISDKATQCKQLFHDRLAFSLYQLAVTELVSLANTTRTDEGGISLNPMLFLD